MNVARRLSVLIGVCCVLSLTVAACGGGGGVPSDAVVKIGGDPIKKAEFDHWFVALAKMQGGTTGGKAVVPRPPEFTACIAQLRAGLKRAKAQKVATEAKLKAQCQQQYNGLRDQILNYLITSAWTEGEAYDKGVRISDMQVAKDLDKQAQSALPSGSFSREDQLYFQRMQELTAQLNRKNVASAGKVTDADVAAYYNGHKKEFALPERRDLEIVQAKTAAKGKRARQQLAGGASFKEVGRTVTPDVPSDGGVVPNLAKSALGKPLGNVAFGAKKGVLIGPVKTQFGYLVFRVVKITPPGVQPLAEVKGQIRQTLTQQRQQAVTDRFQKKWRGRTECHKGYVIPLCKNAPKSTTTNVAAKTTSQ